MTRSSRGPGAPAFAGTAYPVLTSAHQGRRPLQRFGRLSVVAPAASGPPSARRSTGTAGTPSSSPSPAPSEHPPSGPTPSGPTPSELTPPRPTPSGGG